MLFPVGLQHQPEITEAIKGMDRDLVARMLEAGCIDKEILSMNLTEEEMKDLGVERGDTAGGRVITEFASPSLRRSCLAAVRTRRESPELRRPQTRCSSRS